MPTRAQLAAAKGKAASKIQSAARRKNVKNVVGYRMKCIAQKSSGGKWVSVKTSIVSIQRARRFAPAGRKQHTYCRHAPGSAPGGRRSTRSSKRRTKRPAAPVFNSIEMNDFLLV